LPHDEVVYFFMPSNDFVDNSDQYMKLYGDRYRPYFRKKPDSRSYKIIYPPDAVPSESFPSGGSSKGAGGKGKADYLKMILIGYTWSANAIRTIIHLDRFLRSMPNSKISPINGGYFTDDNYSVDGALYYVEKMFGSMPREHRKTIIVVPRKIDLIQIKNRGWSYKELHWYRQLRELVRKHNARLIDLALNDANEESLDYIDNGIENWFLKCDWHWSEAGYELALRRFLSPDGSTKAQ
ncbi:MAG: hypothetical protein MJE12_08375, partial [Alphaproteobacteria bacterium]|nr:hypothetical protein [Alphaproteobacteria bacterium]